VGDRLTDGEAWLEVYSRAQLPTRWGEFELFVLRSSLDDKEHLALVRGKVRQVEHVPVRVHSECLTGDTLGSLRCDCRDQLEMTLETMGRSPVAMVLYLRQEGRGIGLGNKIRAYALQQQEGLDTVDANLRLGFADDMRDYRVAALMLRLFEVRSIRLATNNPRKLVALQQHGVEISARDPIWAVENAFNRQYLATKANRSGHWL
jgi:GTP cyclohydrolase II